MSAEQGQRFIGFWTLSTWQMLGAQKIFAQPKSHNSLDTEPVLNPDLSTLDPKLFHHYIIIVDF